MSLFETTSPFFFHFACMLCVFFAPGPVQGMGEYSQTRQTQFLFLSAGEERQVIGNYSAYAKAGGDKERTPTPVRHVCGET